MSFNDSFAGYLLFEIMMRVLNNKIEKMTLNVKIIIICNILFFPICVNDPIYEHKAPIINGNI